MNFLIVHRRYRQKGGEDFFLENLLIPSLDEIGAKFTYLEFPALFGRNFWESIAEVLLMFLGWEKLRPSFFKIKKQLQKESYTHVLFNNLAPTISLDAPQFCRSKGLKTFWWLHNARHSCANGLLFNGQAHCHKCLTMGSHNAFFQNCYSSRLQSFIYAWVYRKNRVPKHLLKSIDVFIAPAKYTLQSLQAAFQQLLLQQPRAQIIRFPIANTKIDTNSSKAILEKLPPTFYLFLGRLSAEKGADIFVNLATKFPSKNFVMAGDGPLRKSLEMKKSDNLFFVGQIGENDKKLLFSCSHALIICSRVPENSPLVIYESHPWGLPVVYPRGGGAEEIVKYLHRSGCALDEFTGQDFEKTDTKISDDFHRQLKDLFAQ